MRVLAIIALLILASCGSTPSRPVCLPVAPYSAETQTKAADEMEALEKDGAAPNLRKFIEDYGELRARALAACQ